MNAAAPLPPQNLDAEESILGALLLSDAAVAAVRDLGLRSIEFYRESHGRIFNACFDLHRHGEPVDAITVADKLEELGQLAEVGGKQRIHELASLVPATSNVLHYAGIVREMAQLRQLANVGERIQRLAWERPQETPQLIEEARALVTALTEGPAANIIDLETWRQFEAKAGEHVDCVVDRLWPTSALGFIAAPPKKGKTWLGLSLALSVATGTPFLGQFNVPRRRPVIYLALEGHRAAIRARVGALARGLGADPDGTDLDNFYPLYKPRGVNIADPAWVQRITTLVERIEAAIVIVDVLRAAAAIKENSNEEFNQLRATLQPLSEHGCAIALLHHFGKLSEISRERTPGERMAGAGSMYGAMDVGIFITGSDKEARTLRLEFEVRDVATPDEIGIRLAGEGTGENGGFIYRDTATWEPAEEPEPDELKAPAQMIYDLVTLNGGEMTSVQILAALEADGEGIDSRTLFSRDEKLERLGMEIRRPRGKPKVYLVKPPEEATNRQLGLMVQTPEMTPTTQVGSENGFRAQTSTIEPPDPGNGDTPEMHTVSEVKTAPLSQIPTPEARNPYYVGDDSADADFRPSGEHEPRTEDDERDEEHDPDPEPAEAEAWLS